MPVKHSTTLVQGCDKIVHRTNENQCIRPMNHTSYTDTSEPNPNSILTPAQCPGWSDALVYPDLTPMQYFIAPVLNTVKYSARIKHYSR